MDAGSESLAYFYARENDSDANTAGVSPWTRRGGWSGDFAELAELSRPRLGVGFL